MYSPKGHAPKSNCKLIICPSGFHPSRMVFLLSLLLLGSSSLAFAATYGSDAPILLDEDMEIDYGGELMEYAGDARILNSTFNSTYALLFVAAVSAVLVVIGTFLFLSEESSHDFTKDRRRTRFHSTDYEYLYDDGRYLRNIKTPIMNIRLRDPESWLPLAAGRVHTT